MATNYPAGIDSFTNPAAGDALNSPSHSAQHANANDAIEAVQTELGTTPSGSESTVAARLTAIESGARMGTGSIGATALANDAVDTAAIQDSAVTSAKIADGTITATDVAASTFAAFGTVGNLLTDNQASGGDTLGDTTGFVDSGHETTRIYITSDSKNGAGCIKTTLVGASSPLTNLSGAFACTPGETVTFLVALKVAATSGKVRANLKFKLADDSYVYVEGTNLTGSAWGWATVTSVAPATAVSVSGYIYAYDFAPGEYYLLDSPSIHKGAGGQWAMPGTPIVGGSHVATNGAVHLSGTGAPEGVVTAAPGSTWLDTSSVLDVSGWARYEKLSGTSNTGWALGAGYDSGSRDLSGVTMSNSWAVSGSLFKLQRVGRTVSIDAAFTKASASADAAYTLPVGFRPLQATVRRICNTDTADDFVTVSITSAGVISIVRSSMSSNIVYLSLSFLTPTTAPSSLPGT